jgi:GNAT superfamily N-acetyltransferase
MTHTLPNTDCEIIDLTPDNIADYGVCGYKDVNKHAELRNKIDWFERYYPKGLRIKALISQSGGYQGMLEYIPGEFAHRPVNAAGYMFIHCAFVGFRKGFKGKGYASAMIDVCLDEAREAGMQGVAVVTRKGAFMAKDDIFTKLGFKEMDSAKPDFNLLAFKFDPQADDPGFRTEVLEDLNRYQKGLTVMRSPQCPYTEKNVKAILQTAEEKFGLKPVLVDMNDAESAQKCPCPFGAFCIIYNGKVISHHPISNKRFENIMNKLNHG